MEPLPLVMIEPPREPLVSTVFEVDDSILIAVELLGVEGVTGAVHGGRVGDLGPRMHLCAVKFSEDRRGRGPVKTVAVIKYAKFHIIRFTTDGKTF